MKYPKVGELVAKDIRTAEIFKKSNIDFCCGGGISLDKACKKAGVNPDEILIEIEKLQSTPSIFPLDYESMPLTDLSKLVVNKHHKYVEESIDFIEPILNKVIRVHGAEHPELEEIGDLFFDAINDLSAHMKREEQLLFPLVEKIEKSVINGNEEFRDMNKYIDELSHDHDSEGERMKKMLELSNNFDPPVDACNSYRLLYFKLNEFYDDLQTHIHLENNIIFPKAIKLSGN